MADAPPVAWRMHRGDLKTDWFDGAPGPELLEDVRKNAPNVVFEYAFAAAQPQPQPAQPLTDEQIEALLATPANLAWLVSSKTERITLLIRAVERAHGITAPSTPTPPPGEKS